MDGLNLEYTITPHVIVIHKKGQFLNFPDYFMLTDSQITALKKQGGVMKFFGSFGIVYDNDTSIFYLKEKKVLIFTGSQQEREFVSKILTELDAQRIKSQPKFYFSFLNKVFKTIKFNDLQIHEVIDNIKKTFSKQYPNSPSLPYLLLDTRVPNTDSDISGFEETTTDEKVKEKMKYTFDVDDLSYRNLFWYLRFLISKDLSMNHYTFSESLKSYEVAPEISKLILESVDLQSDRKDILLKNLLHNLGVNVPVTTIKFIPKYNRLIIFGNNNAHFFMQMVLENLYKIYEIKQEVKSLGESLPMTDKEDFSFKNLDIHEIENYIHKKINLLYKKLEK